MSTLLVFGRKQDEIDMLRSVSDCIDGLREDVCFFVAQKIKELNEVLKKLSYVSVCCVDFSLHGEQAINIIREHNPETMVIILADVDISPSKYIRPSIMAAGLLLRPLTPKQVNNVLKSVLSAAADKEQTRVCGNEMFTVNTREGAIKIPYSELLYFEARNKKIAACTGRFEAEFYSTLDSLDEKLPGYFIRCHKSFIINTLKVEQVNFPSNTIFLARGFSVPLSRSYRSSIREALT